MTTSSQGTPAEELDDILKLIMPDAWFYNKKQYRETQKALLSWHESTRKRSELVARRDELRRAANHNNSEYTSDYLEDRLEAIDRELAEDGGSK